MESGSISLAFERLTVAMDATVQEERLRGHWTLRLGCPLVRNSECVEMLLFCGYFARNAGYTGRTTCIYRGEVEDVTSFRYCLAGI